ncbi:TPA: major capsid protein [Streptococcus suis]
MVLIHEQITAANIGGFYNAVTQGVNETLGQRLFPVRKQLGLDLSFIKGAMGRAVALRPSAFDVKTTLRDRMSIDITTEEMPFFKEGLLVKERDRQELNTVAMTGNQTLIDTVLKRIFDDEVTLIQGAKARLEAMRMQVLATGRLAVNANGVALDYDYGVSEANRGKAETPWSEVGATPLADIESAIEALENLGGKADVMVLNSVTFNQLKNAESTLNVINPVTKAKPTRNQVFDYLSSNYDIQLEIVNDTYVDDDGQVKKFYPDGYVSFVPNATLGATVFGTTPEESDLVSSQVANVSVVETGIAVTTVKENDPVNVLTKVSMIALPSFEGINQVYFLNVGEDEI